MTVLIILLVLIIVGILALSIAANIHLFQRLLLLQREQEIRTEAFARDLLTDARAMSERTPAELQKLLNHVSKAQETSSKNLIEMVRTAWNPAPTTPADTTNTPYVSPFPVPIGADEATRTEAEDPTDRLIPRYVDSRPDAMLMDPAPVETNPFGLPGIEFKDPLAGLMGKAAV